MKPQRLILPSAIFALIVPMAVALATPQATMAAAKTAATMPAHSSTVARHHERQMMRKRWAERMANSGRSQALGTVSALDQTTGMVTVKADGHSQQLYFSPSSVAHLTVGDRVQVRTSFRKITPEMEAKMKARQQKREAAQAQWKAKHAAAEKKQP